MNATSIALRLRAVIDSSLPLWRALSDDAASIPLAPNKWSRKEVLGHLIDSASNNHQRFVRAHFQSNLVFVGYEQNDWVTVQRYNTRPLDELISLWSCFNVHIAHVIEHTPRELTERLHHEHNLDQIAFRTVPRSRPTSLATFHTDYIDHLEHHLRQAFTTPLRVM